MKPARTVAALHDLSGVGRCALTVVIPVISAMGVQVIPAPTAVLSAHTAFDDFVSMDLTDYLDACLAKWVELGWSFDCVYTGYMASVRQEEIARRFMEAQPRALRVVDPVLGDDGVMYRALPKDMPAAMARLCRGADVITPNLTEAALLTGEPCPRPSGGTVGAGRISEVYSESRLRILLEKLLSLKPKTALITGVNLEGQHANAWMGQDGILHTLPFEPVPAAYPGTGDLFASVLTGSLVQNKSMEDAVRTASDFVRDAMRLTLECGTDPIYGVQLEPAIRARGPSLSPAR